jgi:hypothetical protein
VTKSSERQEQSLTQAKIDPLRQGQRLDAIDQKPKHDSSKTEVTLDAVMQEAEGKRGNQEPKPKQKLPKQNFSLSQVQLSQNDALTKPCAQQVFQKSNKSPPCSITSLKILPLVGTCTHQGYKDLELPLKLRLPLNRCYAMNAMQEV